MNVLLLDNYDSFVHTLARYLRELGAAVTVVRNDRVTLEDVESLAPSHLVLSPGPCGPAEAGVCVEAIRRFAPTTPILGVCLGHQCLAAAFGGAIVRTEPVHGRTTPIRHDGRGLFTGVPDPLRVTRYHSLAVDTEGLPPELEVTARAEDGVIMALRHRTFPAAGVQFHPEAVLTEEGHTMLGNFLRGAP